MSDADQDEQRVSTISHHICGCHACTCEGDEHGADTDKALCFKLARQILKMSEADRRELALDIAPELCGTP